MDAPKMTANPFAALLDGVPRYTVKANWITPVSDGDLVRLSDVLSALAAVPADLEGAGEIAEQLLREADGFSVRASDTIRALLARIAAQEAQIKGLEASAGKLRAEYGQTIEQRNDQIRIKLEWAERAFAAETALAAEKAKTAKLVEALTEIEGGESPDHWVPEYQHCVDVARAAITEAGQ